MSLLLFAGAAVAAATTAALRAYLVEGVDAALAAAGEDDGNRDLAVVAVKDDGNSDPVVAEDDGHRKLAVVVVKDNGHGKRALLPIFCASPSSPSRFFGPAMRPHSPL